MSNVPATTFTYLGGQFQIGDGGNPTEIFTTIAQVVDVDFNGSKRDTEETTSADNTDAYKRFAGRLIDPGGVTIDIWWNPNDPTHQQFANANDGAAHNFKSIVPGFGTRSFAAIIETPLDLKFEINKGVKKQIKLKVSGPITESVAGA